MDQTRRLALDILQQVGRQRLTLDRCLEKQSSLIQILGPADRALLHQLVFGVLRWQLRLDWIIHRLTAKSRKKIHPVVLNILRLGLYQILYLDRIPHAAAVNTAVDLARTSGNAWATGFINGLLRRAAGKENLPDHFQPPDDPVEALSIEQAFPDWLVSRWYHRLGATETRALCSAMNKIPVLTLRTNTMQIQRQDLMAALADHADFLEPTVFAPEGIRLRSSKQPLSEWESFRNGWFQIQDEAAQLVAHLLNPQPGHRVWDACAGLGTKTFHLAQLMQDRGHILSTDKRVDKLKRLSTDMARQKISCIETRQMDLLTSTPDVDMPLFDRILVDAPCSGIGVLQKNPDGKWRLSPEDLKRYAHNQAGLLARTAPFLKPEGILVYSVCSIEPEENESVIDSFLSRHPNFAVIGPKLTDGLDLSPLTTPRGYLYTLPHRHHMDGFFAVSLIKKPSLISEEL